MAQRADLALTGRGLVKSRSRAKALIAAGQVLCNGIPLTKPSAPVEETDTLTVTGDIPYVGRGGLKLEEALRVFPVNVRGKVCMDIGASTGGFTDCMLQNGAALVYAVDVGHDQLDPALRADPRVVNKEGTDIRMLRQEELPEIPAFLSIDVSFISLHLVLPAAFDLLGERGDCIVLVKPQFEAGRQALNKQGIVRSAKDHICVLQDVTAFAGALGFIPAGLCVSPVQGGSGNTEYLCYLTKNPDVKPLIPDIHSLVQSAGLH